jgi:hypothetical protein
MSCANQGHVGAADSGLPPEYRCIYCGEWGYAPAWTTEDSEEYEQCDCQYSYEDHRKNCNG